jgi:hypothetical protein
MSQIESLAHKTSKIDLNPAAGRSEFYSDASGVARRGLSIAKRPDQGGSKGRKTEFRTNYYDIEIDYTKTAYQFDVDIICSFTRKDGSQANFNVKRENRK